MADRSGDHEEMPDEMVVPDPLRGEEGEASCISKSAGENQENSGNGNQL